MVDIDPAQIAGLSHANEALASQRAQRVIDFKELERLPATQSSKSLMGILVAIVLFAVFAWAFYLLMKGRSVTPTSPLPLD